MSQTAGRICYTGHSVDIVAHEVGHAVLDSLRPELYDSPFPEIAAFHESFGDCLALLTALLDENICATLLNHDPTLTLSNPVQAIGEDLAQASSVTPRQALNSLLHLIPLPLNTEPHYYSQVFTGCFYDLIRLLFNKNARLDVAALKLATSTAGRLLAGAVNAAGELSYERYFQQMGALMVKADEADNAGINRALIGQAFNNHGIALGSSLLGRPQAELAGAVPNFSGGPLSFLSPKTVKELKCRMHLPATTRFKQSSVVIGKKKLVVARHNHTVDLSKLGKGFRGVVALAPRTLLVGAEGGCSCLCSPLPCPFTAENEVMSFISCLANCGMLEMTCHASAKQALKATCVPNAGKPLPTHGIVEEKGKKVLRRLRFTCG